MLTRSSHTLVLGGARSGKSAWAEAAAHAASPTPIYLATATALDGEMAARIGQHRARRDAAWTTVEEPLELGHVLMHFATPGTAVVVDCLTLWLTNLMLAHRDVEAAVDGLLDALATVAAPVILVSNEVGQGVVPMSAMARAFVDHAGRAHQRLAAACPRVVLMTAGLPLALKGDL